VEQIKSAANLFDKIHHDVNASSDTFKSLPAESTAPLVAFDKQLSLLNPVIHGLISMDGNVASCSIAGPEGQAPVAPPAPPPAPVPVPVPAPGDTNAAPILPPAPPPAPPDISYELREWRTWPEVDQNHPVFSKINVLGHPDSYIENIPVDQKFHFHRRDGNIYANDYVNPNTGQPGKLVEPWLEVPCYFDWCAIRLLSQGTPAGDGTTWTVKVDVTHPDVTFIFTFQHPLPQLQQWPTRDAILSGN